MRHQGSTQLVTMDHPHSMPTLHPPPSDQLLDIREKYDDVCEWLWWQAERKAMLRKRDILEPTEIPIARSTSRQVAKESAKVRQLAESLAISRAPLKVPFVVGPMKNPRIHLIERPILRKQWTVLNSRCHVNSTYRRLQIPTLHNGDKIREQAGQFSFFCPNNIPFNTTKLPKRTRARGATLFKQMANYKSIDCSKTILKFGREVNVVRTHLDALKKLF